MATTQVTMKNFEELVEKNNIVILDFWAEWCGPCRMFAPIFEDVSAKHPDIVFGKVNTEEEQELSGGFRIRSIPTLMIFREGILLFEQPGMLPAEALESIIQQVRNLDMNDVRKKMEEQAKQAP